MTSFKSSTEPQKNLKHASNAQAAPLDTLGGHAENNHQFQLIKGSFTPEEAENVLFELIANKIKFHNLESFILQERYNADTTASQMRIEELKGARESLRQFLQAARENNWNLDINGKVEISVRS